MTNDSPHGSSEAPSAADVVVDVRGVEYQIASRVILSGFDLAVRRGRVTGIMGPSGTGKTTLLKLITAEAAPTRGRIVVCGRDLATLDRAQVFALRKRMGMLFQNGALLTDMDVFENVAFPLREHTDLTEPLIRALVIVKLNAVGLRGAAELMPAELSGGMARRVALARAIVMDPEILIYDEPFVGLDPISRGVILRLIREMNEGLGITSIVVSHDVHDLARLRTTATCLGRTSRRARHAGGAARSESADVRQFMRGDADGPVPFHYPAPDLRTQLLSVDERERAAARLVADLRHPRDRPGRAVPAAVARPMRRGARAAAPRRAPDLQRGGALADHRDALGLVRRHGARAAGLRPAATIRLRRRARNRGGALLDQGARTRHHGITVRRPGGNLAHVRDRAHARDRSDHGDAVMAVDPMRYVVAPRFLGGVVAMPLLACVFNVVGLLGAHLVGVQLMGVDRGAFS